MSGRYHVRACRAAPADGARWDWPNMDPVIDTDDMGKATRAIIETYEGGRFACQIDTRPDEPRPVNEIERLALAGIMPKIPRTVEN